MKYCYTVLLRVMCCLGLMVSLGWTRESRAAEADADLIVVKEVYWGFDNLIPKDTFLPVSFLVQNTGVATVTASLKMCCRAGSSDLSGTVLQQEVTLAGESERWVQFVPYLEDELDIWQLSWGAEERHQMTLPQVNAGRPATVLIYDRTAVTPPPGPLRRFPEELFPTSVVGTQGLRGVILENTPRWQGARARAFLEWLQQGGRVYLLKGDKGTYPQFAAPLEELNQAFDEYRVGQGTVKRVPRTLPEIDLRYAQIHLFNDDQLQLQRSRPAPFTQTVGYVTALLWNRGEWLTTNLVTLARFRRNWILIYLSVLAYILTLWPGCFRVGKYARDYRWFYVAFFGAVIGYSIWFVFLGQLGARVTNRIRCLAVAQHLGEGAYYVRQWNTLGVPRGGTYRVSQPGSGTSYQHHPGTEPSLATFQVGSDAWAEFAMAPSSTRSFYHETRLATPRPAPMIRNLDRQEFALGGLEVDCSQFLETSPEAAALYFQGSLYSLSLDGNVLKLSTQQRGRSLEDYFTWQPSSGGMGLFLPVVFEDDPEDRSDRQIYQDSLSLLMTYGLQIDGGGEALVPEGFARLLIYARMPKEFLPDLETFPDQSGRVLYSFDIPVN